MTSALVIAVLAITLGSALILGRKCSTSLEKIAFVSGLAGFVSVLAAIPLLLKDAFSLAGAQQEFQITLSMVAVALAAAAILTAAASSLALFAKRVRT